MKKEKISYRKIWKYIGPFVKKYKGFIIAEIILQIIAFTISHAVIGLLFKQMIDVGAEYGSNPIYAATLLVPLLVYIVVLRAVRALSGAVAIYLQRYGKSKIERDLTVDAFDRLVAQSTQFFANNFSGSLIAKSRRYGRAFAGMYDVSMQFLTVTVVMVTVIAVLATLHTGLATLFSFWSVVFVIISIRLVLKKKELDVVRAQKDSIVTGRLADVITNILNVKVFASQSREYAGFEKVTEEEHQARVGVYDMNAYIYTILGLWMAVLFAAGLWLSIDLWVAGQITLGSIALVQSFVLALSRTIWNVSKAYTRLVELVSDMEEIIHVFETPVSVQDPVDPKPLVVKNGAIDFANVDFTYRDGGEVFDGFNLSIKAGENVGLVGYSGGGKTTITNMLLRLVNIDGGDISIDGQSIYDVTQNDLRSHISYVPQEPLLFHRSIFENIAYGKPGATHDEVIEAAKKARVHDFVQTLPDGYDTMVGERGIKLSGGQKQRIAVARIILENAPILVLDEATSSLDSVTEKDIQDAFMEVMDQKTSIVIAHRLSTVKALDRIIVLENGNIVEDGPHEELMKKGGTYAELWSHQSSVVID